MLSYYILGTGCILAMVFFPRGKQIFPKAITLAIMSSLALMLMPWQEVSLLGVVMFLILGMTHFFYGASQSGRSLISRLILLAFAFPVFMFFIAKIMESPSVGVLKFGLALPILAFAFVGMNIQKYKDVIAGLSMIYSVALYQLLVEMVATG